MDPFSVISFEYNKICRLCLSHDGNMSYIYNELLISKISSFTSLRIQPGDGLPTLICLRCLQLVEQSYEFKKRCESSDAFLKQYLNKQQLVCTLTPVMNNIKDGKPQQKNVLVNGDVGKDITSLGVLGSAYPMQLMLNNTFVEPIVMVVNPDDSDYESPTEDNVKTSSKGQQSDQFNNTNAVSKSANVHTTAAETQTDTKNVVGMYGCTFCNKSFADSSSLSAHVRLHQVAAKPFDCKTCGETFSTFKDLRQHEHIHTIPRAFICPVCSKAFSRSTNLSKHIRIHTGVRPFACDQCPKTFQARGDLVRHQLVHSGIKPFSCELCTLSFSRKDKLNRHMKTHEPQNSSPLDHLGEFATLVEMDREESFENNKRKKEIVLKNRARSEIETNKKFLLRSKRRGNQNELKSPNSNLKTAKQIKAATVQKCTPPSKNRKDKISNKSVQIFNEPVQTEEEPFSENKEGLQESTLQCNRGFQKRKKKVVKKERERNRLRVQKFREKMTEDEKEKRRAKEREYYHKKKAENKVKSITDLSDREKRLKRKRWRINSKKYYENKKAKKEIASQQSDVTKPDSTQKRQGRKIVKKCKATVYRKNKILTEGDVKLGKKVKMLQRRGQRKNLTSIDSSSPNTKVKPKKLSRAAYAKQKRLEMSKDPVKCAAYLEKERARNRERRIKEKAFLMKNKKALLQKRGVDAWRQRRYREKRKRISNYTAKQRQLLAQSKLNETSPEQLKQNNPSSNYFHCNTCYEIFTDIDALREHQKTHSGPNKHSCKTCGKEFNRWRELYRHEQIHTGEKPFECEQCGKRFMRKDKLLRHSRVHSDKKPFKCSECPSSFEHQDDLTRHQLNHSHTPESRWTCRTCFKAFPTRLEMTKHIHALHAASRPKPFKCPHCKVSFYKKDKFNRHVRSHTVKRLACDLCSFTCLKKAFFEKHMKTHEPAQETAGPNEGNTGPITCETNNEMFFKDDIGEVNLDAPKEEPKFEEIKDTVKMEIDTAEPCDELAIDSKPEPFSEDSYETKENLS